MRSLFASSLMLLPLAFLCGCGESAAPPAAAVAPAPQKANPPAEKVEAPKTAPRPARRERPPGERAKVAQLFQVPQINLANTGNYGVRNESGGTPQIRLIGFSRLDGELRALVQVRGETLPVEQGDVIDGANVVSIDADGVSFQYGGQRWTSRLFEKMQQRPVVVARAQASSSSAVGGATSSTPLPTADASSAAPPPVYPSPGSAN